MRKSVKVSGRAMHLGFGIDLDRPQKPRKRTKTDPSWPGIYRIRTHGKTDEEIVADAARLEAHHQAKSDRLDEMQSLFHAPLEVDGALYVWTDATIRERGTDVEVYLCVRDGLGQRLRNMPIVMVRSSVAAIPSTPDLVDIVRAAIRGEIAEALDDEEEAARLASLIS